MCSNLVKFSVGRSASVLAQSQLLINPDIREAHLLKGWYDREGQSVDFQTYRSEGGGSGGGGKLSLDVMIWREGQRRLK